MKKKTKIKASTKRQKPTVKSKKTKKSKRKLSKFGLTLLLILITAVLGGAGFLIWYFNLEYTVTFVDAQGVAYSGFTDLEVKNGKSFSFSVSTDAGITHYSQLGGITANGVQLTESEGVYTISNIRKNQTIEAFGYGTIGHIIEGTSIMQGGNTATAIIPYGITEIYNGAFAYSSSLTTVYIPTTVKTIKDGGFAAPSLTTVNIPLQPISVGIAAFEGSAWLTAQPNGIVYVGKIAYTYKGTMPASTNLTLAPDTLGIASYAFMSQANLVGVAIPSSVEMIGTGAFIGCINLNSVSMGSNVKSLGKDVFFGSAWYNAQPDGLIYLNNWLYEYKGVPSTTTITVREGIIGIGGGAFEDLDTIATITLPTTIKYICTFAFSDNGISSITFPSGLLVIEEYAFLNSSLTSLNIPSSVTKIGSRAFEGSNKITQVAIYANLERLNSNLFWNCSGITDITIFGTISKINSDAFESCNNLTNLTLHSDCIPSIIGDNFLSSAPAGLIISVPSSQLTAYQTAVGWSAYASKIVALEIK